MRSFVITLLAGLALWGLVLLHDSNASVFDKKTIWTFNEAVQIPGMVLDPGTYVMKRALPMTNPQVVRFLDASEKRVYATVFAIPVERQRPTSEPEITFAEARGGAPHALKRWFYPGELTGAEFVYSKESTVLAASVSQQTVEQPAVGSEDEGVAEEQGLAPRREPEPQALETEPAPEPSETYKSEGEIAQARPPAQEPTPTVPEAATATQEAPSMPETAGNLPLLLLLGGMAFAVGTAFKKAPWQQRS